MFERIMTDYNMNPAKISTSLKIVSISLNNYGGTFDNYKVIRSVNKRDGVLRRMKYINWIKAFSLSPPKSVLLRL